MATRDYRMRQISDGRHNPPWKSIAILLLSATLIWSPIGGQTLEKVLSLPSPTTGRDQRAFASDFRIERDSGDPSHLLNIILPPTTPGIGRPTFQQFFARVTDVSPELELRQRDANRTFPATPTRDNSAAINIHGLNAGHEYIVTVLGRSGEDAVLLHEESVVMEPLPLDFSSASSHVSAGETNITLRAVKSEHALQDSFRVEYSQLGPPRRFPVLEVHDIVEQREVELYLGNLVPGRDYQISVTSLQGGLPSQPWRGVVTTQPLKPADLRVADAVVTPNTSATSRHCVQLSWLLPPESGADKFRVTYGPHIGTGHEQQANTTAANALMKPRRIEVDATNRQLPLCEGILPGASYLFTILAEKRNQYSDVATLTHTVRPLPPRELSVEADFSAAKFRVEARLAPANESTTNKCRITAVSEHSEKLEELVEVVNQGNDTAKSSRSCVAYMDLVPGRRYEFSAAAISNEASSTKILANQALEPGFNSDAFALQLNEERNGTQLRLNWPTNETAMAKMEAQWAGILGNGTKLHFKVSPHTENGTGTRESTQQVETALMQRNRSIVAEHLNQGACYKVQIYTVTASGIVSKQRYERFIRLQPPEVRLTQVGQITRSTAQLTANLLPYGGPQLAAKGAAYPSSVSDECFFRIFVMDQRRKVTVSSTKARLRNETTPSLHLDGLKPFTKYEVNSHVVCGEQRQKEEEEEGCSQRNHTLPTLVFETRQDRPGPITVFSARPASPHSANLTWLPPATPNGVITHYVISVQPLATSPINATTPSAAAGGNEVGLKSLKSWQINVPASVERSLPSMIGIDPAAANATNDSPTTGKSVEYAIFNLVGGHSYRFTVAAATSAGIGDAQSDGNAPTIETPIGAPPHPSAKPEVPAESIHTSELEVHFDAGVLSSENGMIQRIAIIVTEVPKLEGGVGDMSEQVPHSGERNLLSPTEASKHNKSSNATTTWAHVRSMDPWPPYTALELEPGTTGSWSHIGEVIGSDISCEDREPDALCNGPLKPARRYRFKLRLFTTPSKWTDTNYSDVVETKELKPDVFSSARGILGTLLLILLPCVATTAFCLLLYTQRHSRTRKRGGCLSLLTGARTKRTHTSRRQSPFAVFSLTSSGSDTVGCTAPARCAYPGGTNTVAALHSAYSPSHYPEANAPVPHFVQQADLRGDSSKRHDQRRKKRKQKKSTAANGYIHPIPASQNTTGRRYPSENSNTPSRGSSANGGYYTATAITPGFRDKESQWTALKMMMAERAADCLAKLGLDSHSHHRHSPSSSDGTATTTGTPGAGSSGSSSSSSSSTARDSPTTAANVLTTAGGGGGCEAMDQSTGLSPPQQHWAGGGGQSQQQQQQWGRANTVQSGGATREPLRVLGGIPPSVHFQTPPPTSTGEDEEDNGDRVSSLAHRTASASASSPSRSMAAAAANGSDPFNSPHHRRSKSLRERTGVDQRLERLPSGPPPGQKSAVLWTVVKGQAPVEKSRPIRLGDFAEHVRLMSADSDFRFSEEYEELRNVGLGQPCIAADSTANRAKNRFTNILPYDHSRVKLNSSSDGGAEDGLDYVNASYIPGFNSRHEFIAAQGPLPTTRDQFWRLVWEQQCPAIVALTKCVEKGRDKCDKYWPEAGQRSVLYGDIEVTLVEEAAEHEEVILRQLRLVNRSEPSQPSREVLHLHYQAWPDFGVPEHPAGVVNFMRLFRAKLPPSSENLPTIVHCSAGVGRSGTFIAVDRLMHNIELGRPLDIFGCVYEMRMERCHMVQNEQQYVFIHHCLLYTLEHFYPHLLVTSGLSASGGTRTCSSASSSSSSLAAHYGAATGQSTLAGSNFGQPPLLGGGNRSANVFFVSPAISNEQSATLTAAPTRHLVNRLTPPKEMILNGMAPSTNQVRSQAPTFRMEDDAGEDSFVESGL